LQDFSTTLPHGELPMKSYHDQQRVWGIVLAAGNGTRVLSFLTQLCGGSGIKQFCAVTGRRSMLEHTLARVERIIPRERILIIVGSKDQADVAQQIRNWPVQNIIYQPANRETAPGILLPLAHISQRDPGATVAIFPSDHFVLNEPKFMSYVNIAIGETEHYSQELILLGMTPDAPEEGYGWIEPEPQETPGNSLAVRRFWEKPPLSHAYTLWKQGALWNTFVGVANAGTIWRLVRDVAPDLYEDFLQVRQAIGTPAETATIQRTYQRLRVVNFSADVCQLRPHQLRVFPVPPVGWSDWGSAERILASFEQLGRRDELVARLSQRQRGPVSAPRARISHVLTSITKSPKVLHHPAR
jgi:mannose-1-phosphate guanylyltransferase